MILNICIQQFREYISKSRVELPSLHKASYKACAKVNQVNNGNNVNNVNNVNNGSSDFTSHKGMVQVHLRFFFATYFAENCKQTSAVLCLFHG